MADLVTFIPMTVLWLVFFFFFGLDRNRYRNCLLLFAALVTTGATLLFTGGETITIIVSTGIIITLLIVPVFLIWNGIVMIRREGRAPAHLLSLILGIVIEIGEITMFIWAFGSPQFFYAGGLRLQYIFAAVSLSVVYASLSFLMFMIYSLFLMIIPRRRDFDYVITLGAGLRNGEYPTKLLSDRIDKAIKVFHEDPTTPFLMPSGGKGADEKISEAEAMKRYMLEKGVPEEYIVKEDASATTLENLVNSKKIIEERGGGKYIAIVTSNYHVYRALRYGRKLGMRCTGIGSHVAFYYWPSALIREYIAIHAEPKHALTFLGGWLLMLALIFSSVI
ncbi:MAG: YdcF family protein [Solobacterium sp.]|nr:YdcF family protein [Solobacterium sp.]